MHRDVRPNNFILTSDSKLKLVDNQFAVDSTNYRECKAVRKNPKMIEGLDLEYAPKKYKWDDLYSITKIIEEIGTSLITQKILDDVKSNIGTVKVILSKRSYVIVRKKCIRLISHIIPVKSWQRKFREL